MDVGFRPKSDPDLPPQSAGINGCIGDDVAHSIAPVDRGGGMRAVATLTHSGDQPQGHHKSINVSVDLPSPKPENP